ncbi:DUF930 domain-containing protein [Devosia sp.]|uniref:DUF930 domain-containing protein n=1 Tax=Devosia sp. TaxID=1871048 RepID=UPI0019E63B0E|nr:DUF930 domain-containing protein [Devosia sp.]MBE0581923.1 DUF930 domain-containing protein [Devosia sp.]
MEIVSSVPKTVTDRVLPEAAAPPAIPAGAGDLAPVRPPALAPRPAVVKPQTPPPGGPEPEVQGLTSATALYAGELLRNPANTQVRDTLPLLTPDERIVQLCSIEALEQIRLSRDKGFPDSLDTSAFEETQITDGKLVAPLGAYRANRGWYYVSFECTPESDLESVREFKFRLGDQVPRDLWEGHELIPEDFDDD